MRILPEIWREMNESDRSAAEEEWGVESKKRDQTRKQFGISEILRPEEMEEYNKALAEAIAKYKIPHAPAMPVRPSTFSDPEQLVPRDWSRAMVVRDRDHEDSQFHPHGWRHYQKSGSLIGILERK